MSTELATSNQEETMEVDEPSSAADKSLDETAQVNEAADNKEEPPADDADGLSSGETSSTDETDEPSGVYSDEDSPPSGDPTELILEAVSHKEEGNTHFKDGDLTNASRCYRKGTTVLKALNKNNSGDEQVKSLLISLQTNLSMVCFKQDKPKMSRDLASKALSVDATNVKALYRRAVASRKMGDFDAARDDLKEALKYDPGNTSVRRELIAIKKQLEAAKEKEKKSLQKAFSKGGEGSFLYNDKEEESKRAAEEKKRKEEEKNELLKKRKMEWEEECIHRMANDEPAISFEDWEKEKKKKEKEKEKEKKRAKMEEEKLRNEQRRKARATAKIDDDSDSSSDELTKDELSSLRGYKKTKDGRTTSYFTKELSTEEKALIGDITPQRLDATPSTTTENIPPAHAAQGAVGKGKASAWNRAGTWEEKNATEWCSDCLRAKLDGTSAVTEKMSATVTDVKDLTGDAAVAITGGKKRYIFDFHARVKYEINGEDGETVGKGTLKLPDIASTSLGGELEVDDLGWKKIPEDGAMQDALECKLLLEQQLRANVHCFVEEFNSHY